MVSAVPVEEVAHVHVALSVDARKINLVDHLDDGRFSWVVCAAGDPHAIEAIVKVCVGWPNDGALPRGELLVVGVLEAIGDAGVANSLLSSLKLLKQFESSRHYTHKVCERYFWLMVTDLAHATLDSPNQASLLMTLTFVKSC